MSKNNKQKKPRSKKVAALIEQLQRRRGVRELAKRFLIVCEDDKSAPNYFHALKRHFKLTGTSILIVGSGGHTQPSQVVARAIEIQERAGNEGSGTLPFEQVWCVIDGDYGNKIQNARIMANQNEVNIAVSTKCFEYWILLHFEESDTSTNDCDTLVHTLKAKQHIPKYEKGKCDFSNIVEYVHEASKRAKKLRKPGIVRGDLPEVQNPCSEIYLLIEAILGAM